MLTFRADGKIDVDLDDHVVTLRRPKYSQFKRYRLAVEDIATDTNRLQAEHGIEVDGDGRIVRLEGEDDDAYRARTRDFNDKVLGLGLGWWRLVANGDGNGCAPLADGEWPSNDDDVPAALIFDRKVMGAVLQHWQTAPLLYGNNGPG